MTPPTRAMVLAAGLGLRMRPLTLHRPKPLISVRGRTMLDRALDHLGQAGVTRCVVNVHWLGGMIRDHLAGRPGILISDEGERLLETGGGIAKALPLLGDGAFFALNADIVFEDGNRPALLRLADAWDDARMDALLLMQPTAMAFGYDGPGDFHLDADGRARRREPDETTPLLFSGVQILHPRLFDGAPEGAFSLNRLYDKAQAAGRLFGIVHDGGWYHIGTPEALGEAEAVMAARESSP
ncbi:MAG: nucleotidyltransferase family protein [Rhodospirillaceae bacterium]|nr:nucleotidyltransferase family protein [Rhodospirillaceae bacterium]